MLLTAQMVWAQKLLFVRLYDTAGKKINKGYLFATTDSSLVLYQGDSKVACAAGQLGFIKTKHSFGHRAGKAALITMAVATVLPAVIILMHYSRRGDKSIINYPKSKHPNPDIPTASQKPARKYIIHGSLQRWKVQKALLEPFL